MIRFSNIATGSLIGKASRKFLSVIPKKWVFPILQGPLRGMRWIVGAQNHGMWLGSYEVEKQFAISSMLQSGQTFYDIGANVGFYTLLGARRVGSSGRVVAVEPLPRNIDILKKHLAINDISNVRVIEKAISDFNGKAGFSEDGHSTSRLAEGGNLAVAVTTIDNLVEEIGDPPDLVKVDIEGAEIGMLRGAKTLLAKHRPIIFIAVHTKEILNGILEIALWAEYKVTALDGTDINRDEFQEEILIVPAESAICTSS